MNTVRHAETHAHYVGVDLAGPRIQAAGFNASFRLLGRVKTSPKPERGPAVVLDRAARCVRDAVDECDLPWAQVRAVGLAVPGQVDPHSGHVTSVPTLGWHELPLKQEMEQRLGVPVFAANDCHLAALAIWQQEFQAAPRGFAAVFPDRCSLAAVLQGGQCAALGPGLSRRAPASDAAWEVSLPAMTAKQLRKALQAGDPQAAQTMQALAATTHAVLHQCLQAWRPEVIVLGGALAEELGTWLMKELQRLPSEAGTGLAEACAALRVSALGKDAALVGAALWAAQWASAAPTSCS